MRKGTLAVVVAVVACGVFLIYRFGDSMMRPAVPRDMPANAQFLASGFDISDNEAQGNWIGCSYDSRNATDWCRVTDEKGIVLYQGEFLPLNADTAVGSAHLIVSTRNNPKNLWVQGPVEDGPVPAIPLTDGTLLVPAPDQYALSQRWANDPTEYNRIMNALH